MIGTVFPAADLSLWVKAAGAFFAVAGGLIAGYRVQRWLAAYVPGFAKLPHEIGPAVGLLAGVVWLFW
ncbi:hypothetical protein NKI48_02820 [Mesorhizobium sp. M0644]|uniref:hypothetical protein n=1 Tax=Mesorhizobium sp. M0644 TaxID=2956979 RepID=UPI003339053F